jgi:hypothetical protein
MLRTVPACAFAWVACETGAALCLALAVVSCIYHVARGCNACVLMLVLVLMFPYIACVLVLSPRCICADDRADAAVTLHCMHADARADAAVALHCTWTDARADAPVALSGG